VNLSGIRVLDLTRLLPGAFCTMILGDQGADVIKVEEPGTGDYMRWLPPLEGGQGVVFNSLNRNKRAITLNLKSEAGRELFKALREFRASRSTDTLPGTRIGLQLNAPCDGFTTDNQISNLEQRRAEVEQQIASLEDTAQQNDMPPAIIRDAPEILAAAQRPLTPAQERFEIAERQAQLANELNATQDELSGMSEQATALGANLQPPTPGFGGNMTTDLIERLDNRANEIQGALDQAEDAARQAGAGQQ